MSDSNNKRKAPKRRKFKWLLFIGIPVFLLLVIGHFFIEEPEEKVAPIGEKIANCQREFNPRYSTGPYYTGELFDAHFHIPPSPGIKQFFFKQPVIGKDITLNEILCTFDKEKTRGAIGFYFPKKTRKVTLPGAYEIKEYAKDRMHLFISPVSLSNDELEIILEENKGLFVGIGEIGFYEITNILKPVDGEWASKIYKLAAKHGIPVMIHPGRNQLAKVKKVLEENPNTTFILHGYETERDIDELMEKYPNIYYSVDSATLYAMRGKFAMAPGDKFIPEFKENFNSILDEQVGYWKERIEKYPDRFMWGTDRFKDWHFSDEMSALMEEFARAFIGRLDPAVQEKYAYKNAENLLER